MVNEEEVGIVHINDSDLFQAWRDDGSVRSDAAADVIRQDAAMANQIHPSVDSTIYYSEYPSWIVSYHLKEDSPTNAAPVFCLSGQQLATPPPFVAVEKEM